MQPIFENGSKQPYNRNNDRMRIKLLLCGLCAAVGLLFGTGAWAQDTQESQESPSGRELAIGAHFGLPTGLSMKLETQRHSYDLLIAWDLSDFFVAQSHVWLVESRFEQMPRFRYYAGPGLVIQAGEGDLRSGFSANAGIAFQISQFEFFAQVSPLLEIVPSTQGGINAGAGFRIFL